jgi:hypothetical protein
MAMPTEERKAKARARAKRWRAADPKRARVSVAASEAKKPEKYKKMKRGNMHKNRRERALVAFNGHAHSVYALIDPRDDVIRYVGASCQQERLAAHLSKARCKRGNARVLAWIRELLECGMIPRQTVFMTTNDMGERDVAERYYIRKFRSTILNVVSGSPIPKMKSE